MKQLIVLIACVVCCACEQKAEPQAEPAPPPGRASVAATQPAASSAAPSASASAKPAEKPLDAAASSPPLMWVVDNKAGPTYLLGTMHLGADAERQLNPVVWEKLDQAASVMLELDMDSVSQTALMERAMLPAGPTLDEQLGAARWTKLVELVKGTVPETALKKFKPWFALVLMTHALLPPTPPMDAVIHERAKKASKEMLYLETMTEQLDLFDKVMTLELLRDGIDELAKQKGMILDMQKSYLAGDADSLSRAVFDAEEMKKHPAFYKAMFDERNNRWYPTVEKHAKGGKTFIAVGAGHLLGKGGLIALLADHGIKTERVPVK